MEHTLEIIIKIRTIFHFLNVGKLLAFRWKEFMLVIDLPGKLHFFVKGTGYRTDFLIYLVTDLSNVS